MAVGELAQRLFLGGYGCGEALLLSLRQEGVVTVSDAVVRASTGLAAGCGGQREMCGAVISGIQAIGIRYGRADKSVERKAAMERSGRLVERFRKQFGTVTCRELVRDFADFNSGEREEHCSKFVSFVAGRAAELLEIE